MELLPLFSERLMLRRFRLEDLQDFGAYRADPVLARYQGWSPMSEEDTRLFLEQQSQQEFGVIAEWLQIAIVLRNGDRLIGDLGLCLKPGSTAEVGYTLSQAAQGQGYATEAIQTLLDALFQQTDLETMRAHTDTRNTPSIAVLNRLNFYWLHTETTVYRGEECLEQTFEMTRSRWIERQKAATATMESAQSKFVPNGVANLRRDLSFSLQPEAGPAAKHA